MVWGKKKHRIEDVGGIDLCNIELHKSLTCNRNNNSSMPELICTMTLGPILILDLSYDHYDL